MTIKELREIMKEYPDDSFVGIRIHLKDDRDYLDEGNITSTVDAHKCGVDGRLLLIGSDKKS